ncbi:MAG: hypothetical protein JWO82_300 [Akkermansiaceae bacterium]|nr:hypothetical protein [Akkermansiaceae bacterium]
MKPVKPVPLITPARRPAAAPGRQTPAARLLTHIGALLLGGLLAGGGSAVWSYAQEHHSGAAEGAADLSSQEPSGKAAPRRASRRGAQIDGGPGREFRMAWQELSRQHLSKRERLTTGMALLKKWSRVDLEGALQAALSEEWDDPLFLSAPKQCPLARAFSDAFRDQPEEAWRIFQSGRLGVGGRLFQEAMLAQVAQSNPKLTLSLLPEMSPEQRGRILQQAFGNLKQEDRKAALETVAASAGSEEERGRLLGEVMRLSPPPEDPATLRAQWTALPEGPERDAALAGWASKIQQLTPEAFAAELARIPEGQRAGAARAALNGLDGTVNLLPVLDELIAAGDWEYLEKSGAEKFPSYPDSNQAKQLSDWALNLPARPELSDIYQKSALGMALQDPQSFLTVLNSLPPGDWHREQGLVGLAQATLMQGNPAGAAAIMESIADPVAKQAALTNRYNYEILGSRPVTRNGP